MLNDAIEKLKPCKTNSVVVVVVVVSLLRMCQTHKQIQSHIKHLNEIKDLIKI